MVFGLSSSERAVSACRDAGSRDEAIQALIHLSRGIGAGEFAAADFVEDGGLDAVERIAAQFAGDDRISKLAYSAALNTRAAGPALASRPRLAAAVQKNAPALARLLDVATEGQAFPPNTTVEAVITSMAKSEFKDARVCAEGVAFLKKAIDRGSALVVLDWHGDAAILEALKRSPQDARLRQNAFHCLISLKAALDASDSELKTGFSEAGRHTANELLASWSANLEKQTGVIYSPVAMIFAEKHSYYKEPTRSRGLPSGSSCFPWGAPEPPVRQRFIENILISAGMAAGTSALFQVFMGQRISPLGLIPAAMGGAGGAIGGAIGGELGGGAFGRIGGAMVGGAGGAAIGAHAINAMNKPAAGKPAAVPPQQQPMQAIPVGQPVQGYPVGTPNPYPAANPYPQAQGGYYPMGGAPAGYPQPAPAGYPQPPPGYPPVYRDGEKGVPAAGEKSFFSKVNICF
eukprot:tig00020848_g14560.t1